MKLAFSTDLINSNSFLEICNTAAEYGFQGFEMSDPREERHAHPDSVLRTVVNADGKRRLLDRGIEIAALIYPDAIDENTGDDLPARYVEYAIRARAKYLVIHFDKYPDIEKIRPVLTPAINKAAKYGIMILVETKGAFAHTEKVVELINEFKTGVLGACLNIREAYFEGGEGAEATITSLGAYINYVRIGDRKDGVDVPIGEGDLPVAGFVSALKSLNYDGFICCDTNSEITDKDIVLAHFVSYMTSVISDGKEEKELHWNRSKTGTFPWKKYETLDLTFSQVLDTLADTYPDSYAFKYTTLDYTRTYSEFRDDVDRVAAALIALGVKKGHHVAIWATNVPEWFLTFWGCVRIGAVLVTVNTAYKIHEAEYLLRQSDTHTLVMIESCKDSNYKEIMEELCPELESLEPGKPLWAKKLPFLRNVVTVGFDMKGCLNFKDMMDYGKRVPKSEVRRRAAETKPDDVCNMQYTSGTTGFPKGVMLTHRNIVNDGKTIGDRMDLSNCDRMMIQVPMFHCFGMVLSMTSTFTHGGTLCPIPYFSPKSSLACINSEHITCFNGVPTMFIAMFAHPDFAKTDFSYIRTGIMAGSNCPPDLMRRASREMNMREIISVYGQTEAAPGCTMGEVNEREDLRVETVGSAFPGVECKIIDPETGEDLPDGANGEFVARGFNIMKGYYKMPGATAEAIDRDGWLHSGDICCRTEEGYYKVTGRLKDMIIRGGENLYPREIEEFYLTHPKVRDCQVVGVPDKRYGEECCAWIILNKGESAEISEFVEYGKSHMAGHKVPKYFMIVDNFPMNAAGKIQKFKMRDESIAKLGIEA